MLGVAGKRPARPALRPHLTQPVSTLGARFSRSSADLPATSRPPVWIGVSYSRGSPPRAPTPPPLRQGAAESLSQPPEALRTTRNGAGPIGAGAPPGPTSSSHTSGTYHPSSTPLPVRGRRIQWARAARPWCEPLREPRCPATASGTQTEWRFVHNVQHAATGRALQPLEQIHASPLAIEHGAAQRTLHIVHRTLPSHLQLLLAFLAWLACLLRAFLVTHLLHLPTLPEPQKRRSVRLGATGSQEALLSSLSFFVWGRCPALASALVAARKTARKANPWVGTLPTTGRLVGPYNRGCECPARCVSSPRLGRGHTVHSLHPLPSDATRQPGTTPYG